MKRVKAKGGEPRVERALKAEVHTEEYLFVSTILDDEHLLLGVVLRSIDITEPRY
jgi:hypothetical protein